MTLWIVSLAMLVAVSSRFVPGLEVQSQLNSDKESNMMNNHHGRHPRKSGAPKNLEADAPFGLRGCRGCSCKFCALILAAFAVFAISPMAATGEDSGRLAEGYTYTVANELGAKSEPRHPSGDWVLGYRADQRRVVSIKIRSTDGGRTLTGTITYHREGPIGFRAASAGGNSYTVQNRFGDSAPWSDAGIWTIGDREGQRVISLDAASNDAGETFSGSVAYAREGPIRFMASRKPADADKDSAVRSSSLRPAVLGGVKVSINGIGNWKGGDGKPVGGLGVSLKIRAPELTGAKGIRVVVDEARDEAGILLRHETVLSNRFSDLKDLLGSRWQVDGEYHVALALDPQCDPPRNVKVVKTLAGRIELVIPTKDPGSIITASFAKDAGVPLHDAALKAAGVEITLAKPSDHPTESKHSTGQTSQAWFLNYVIKDPKAKIVPGGAEFFDARGEKVNASGGSGGGSGDTMRYSAGFRSKPPSGVVAKFYLITDKSVVSVPFELKDILVPEN